MRSDKTGRIVVHMAHGTPILLQLEVESGSEPISGRLCDTTGLVVRFTGWLSLASAIARAAQLDPRADTTEARDGENRG